MAKAVVDLDALLAASARRNDGRFIRYGSTATGRMRQHSDLDIIADFPDDRAGDAALYAEEVCLENGMAADVRAVYDASSKLLERALDEGVVLS